MLHAHPLRLICAAAVAFLATAAGVWAPPAQADTPVIPDDQSLPWTDPSHASPLEQYLSGFASQFVSRPVRIMCFGEAEWAAIAAQRGADPNRLLGFVPIWWYPSLGLYAQDATEMFLSPRVCLHLWLFAKAAVKPTKCATTQTVTETVSDTEYRLVTVRVKQKKRVRVKGKWVVKTVYVTKRVWKPVTVTKEVTREVPGEPAPCYGLTGATPAGGWETYWWHAASLLTYSHELVHLYLARAWQPVLPQDREEALAECVGMQMVTGTALLLGASEDDARAISRYVWERIYPGQQGTPYWSADCQENGPLDATPNDGVWPRLTRQHAQAGDALPVGAGWPLGSAVLAQGPALVESGTILAEEGM